MKAIVNLRYGILSDAGQFKFIIYTKPTNA